MKKLYLIMNPLAGVKKASRHLTRLCCLFAEQGYVSTVCMTRRSGDGARYARAAADADLIVCIGGDGTLNEVVAGLLASGQKTPIGYIPAGSTNDFGANLGLSRDIIRAARDIMEGSEKIVDAGCFNGRTFCYVASCGVFTRASYAAPQAMKNTFGHLAYVLEGLREVPNIKPLRLRVETDEAVFEDEYVFCSFSNSTTVAGLLTLDPELVQLDDGKFELMLIRKPENAIQLGQIIIALNSGVYHTDLIRFCSTARAVIWAPDRPDWTLDGEYAEGQENVTLGVQPQAVRLLVKE
ncbi:MAG: YegS/Rv2252/BmrU family lipid kinase [Clostridiales bacterium]|nr:YegS/Rv2252/BmrU family lipid kinase [Clostridiales bacterium]